MRFAVKFLGCKVSQADAMLARRQLLQAGHEEVAEKEAELHVINTCCITREAEAKSRQSVRRSLQTAREVYVAGCAVNLRPAQFEEIDPGVKTFTGTAEEVAVRMATPGGASRRGQRLVHRPRARGAARARRAGRGRHLGGDPHAGIREGPGRV